VPQPPALTIDELASATSATPESIRRWRDLGLLVDDAEQFSPEALERIRLIQYAERRGLTAEDVAEACRTQGDVIGEFVELITDGTPRTGHDIEEVAERTGLDPEAMRRLWVASGLGDQEKAYDEDLQAQQWLAVALAAGVPEGALRQLIRVYADAIGRVAETGCSTTTSTNDCGPKVSTARSCPGRSKRSATRLPISSNRRCCTSIAKRSSARCARTSSSI
jgi:hypothetical protein